MTAQYYDVIPPRRSRVWSSKSGLLGAALFGLLYFKVLTAFSYHLGTLQALSYAIDGLLMAALGLTLLQHQHRLSHQARLCLLGLVLFSFYLVAQGGFYDRMGGTLTYYSRFVLPLFLYFGLLTCAANHRQLAGRWSENLVLLVFILGLAGLFFMPDNFNHHETKLPTYFSGLHKSSYIFAITMLLALACYPALSRSRRLLLLPLALFALYMLLEGWGIRTSLVLLVVYIAALWSQRFGAPGKAALFLLLPAAFVATVLVSGDAIDWNRISSGRLTMWQAKLDMLSQASPAQLLFGRGYGSDYIQVPGWFGEKDSHNNYLQTITELGLAGLALLVLNIVMLYRIQPGYHGRALVLAYAATGLLSNGILFRLLPGYLFAVALAYLTFIAGQRQARYTTASI